MRAITLKIGPCVIPLAVRLVSKQGRGATSKPELLREMLQEVLAFFAEHGIDLTAYPITFDSWYGSGELVELLQEMGFDQVLVHAKSNWVVEIGGQRAPLSQHKRSIELEADEWACGDIPVARCKATSPTFGKLVVLFLRQDGHIKVMMAFGRPLRGPEILNIWTQHHGIEQFWKSLKSFLQIHKLTLRRGWGAYATVAIKLLAYLFLAPIAWARRCSIYQLQMEARLTLDPRDFFREHFHLDLERAA